MKRTMTMKRLLIVLGALLLAPQAMAQNPLSPHAAPADQAQPEPAAVGPAAAPAAIPSASDPENLLHLDLSTGGRVTILMRPDKAPNHVERIKTLARRGFYDGLIFHRVIEGFMAQGGDPLGTGAGGSDLPPLKAEFNSLPHLRGTASMARTEEEDSANSQFFIMFQPNTAVMDGRYTAWGRVIAGMQFVDLIDRGEPPPNPTRILKASVGSDNVPPPAPQPQPAVAAAATEPPPQN